MQLTLQGVPDDVRTTLEGHRNVTGTGIGPKQTDAEGTTDREAVIVFVDRKLDESELDDEDVIPTEIEIEGRTYPTDVQESGDVRLLEMQHTAREVPPQSEVEVVEPQEIPSSMSRTDRWRPAPAGVSIGHEDVNSAGTLGTPPLETEEGKSVLLTNSHVAANYGNASTGDTVVQPGRFDGGTVPDDKIGELVDFSKLSTSSTNRTDSALVEVEPDHLQNDIFEIREDLREFTEAEVNEKHKKSGRTTGVTEAKCTARHATFTIGGQYKFVDLDVFGPMSAGGDSGSLIGRERSDGFFGTSLLFAGSSSVTLGIPMANVQDFHGELTPMTTQEMVGPDDMRVTDVAFSASLQGGQTYRRWVGPWADRYVVDFSAQPQQTYGWVSTAVESVYRTSSGLYYLVRVENQRSNKGVSVDVKYSITR